MTRAAAAGLTGPQLGILLRSEDAEERALATEYIDAVTAGLATEKERAATVGVGMTAWKRWRKNGLVKSLPNDEPRQGRPRAPTDPVTLTLGGQRIVVEWVQEELQLDRYVRKARVKTSTGKSFVLAAWEGTKFIEAMTSLGWR
jgi:hypothetical protein